MTSHRPNDSLALTHVRGKSNIAHDGSCKGRAAPPGLFRAVRLSERAWLLCSLLHVLHVILSTCNLDAWLLPGLMASVGARQQCKPS